jgi:uncharacterized protein (TIGR02594 family)
MNEPFWLTVARRNLHVVETPGKTTTPAIARWLLNLKAWWRDDETPWCGVFVAECLREANQRLPRHWYRALAWNDWGLPLDRPTLGCLVVFARSGGGHVGFYVGHDERGRPMVLGGNQGNRVSIAPFDPARIVGYRWPADAQAPSMFASPQLASNGKPNSANEA